MAGEASIREVALLRGYKFVFSGSYDEKEIMPALGEALVIYHGIKEIPILPDKVSQMEAGLVRRSIFGTAAIEGNPFTEEEVAQIIANPSLPSNLATTERARQEILNLAAAYEALMTTPLPSAVSDNKRSFIRDLESSSTRGLLDEDVIKMWHKMVTTNISYEHCAPGQYSNYEVEVGDKKHGGMYRPPKIIEDIAPLMREYIFWLNSEAMLKIHHWLRAMLAHYHLALIHPFGDGNGRTARLVEALLLLEGGTKYLPVMLSNYYYDNLDDYFCAFSATYKSQNNDVTPFLAFALRGAKLSLESIKERINGLVRESVLEVYFYKLCRRREISERERDLLMTVLEHLPQGFSLAELFSNPMLKGIYGKVSERTARRDLASLASQKLLLAKAGRYKLNKHRLDIG